MGDLSGNELLVWLGSLAPRDRDVALEDRFGIRAEPEDSSALGADSIGYHPSGIAPIVHALVEASLTRDDVLVDLGSGLGKVVLVAALLTPARARGVELQPKLVARARGAATMLALDVRFDVSDLRAADVADGTVFFLYTPVVGSSLAAVLDRLRAVAERRAIVICALGLDLDRIPWLLRRSVDAFWLAVYDSVIPGARPRPLQRGALVWAPEVNAIVHELAFVAVRCGE